MSISIENPRAALQNIVVATDFSAASEPALLYSLAIARRNQSKVWIAHVVSDAFFSSETQQRAVDDAWREGHKHMTELFITGKLDGVHAKLQVEQGGVFEVLERIVKERNADLLVVGTRSRSRIGKLLLGSSAESIFRQASCPVLTVGPRTTLDVPSDGPHKILLCTGFSAHSLAAVQLAIRLAERQGAELILLHVGPSEEPSFDTYRSNAISKMRSLVAENAEFTAPPRFLVEFGAASEQILKVANEEKPHMIVLGVRQPEGFARRVRWATAYDVVTNAPCPVLTVRTPESQS